MRLLNYFREHFSTRRVIFDSPNPSSVDPELKFDLGNLCQMMASTFKEISHSDPQIDPDLKHNLNQTFGTQSINAAMIPDEVCRGSADLLCAHLHAIGNLYRTGSFVSPAIIAPQARTIVENAALIHFLCDCEGELRLSRAMRTLRDKMEREGADQDERFSKFYSVLSEAVASNGHINRGKRVRTGEYTELVKREFDSLQGKAIYAELSSLSHHNAWIGYVHEYNVNNFPTDLELEAIDLCAATLQLVLVTCHKLIPHRPHAESNSLHNLESIVLQLNQLLTAAFD